MAKKLKIPVSQVFGLPRQELEPTICGTHGEYLNHYTAEEVYHLA
jgi:hypothetical protein